MLILNLLSENNIQHEFEQVKTASCDPIKKKITFPIDYWKLEESVRNRFIGHECSHMIYTDLNLINEKCKELSKKHSINEGLIFSLINILEDNRVDRKMKIRFPGIKKDYAEGMTILFQNNFFDFNPQESNFIDKINVKSKVPAMVCNIELTNEEQKIFNQVNKTETIYDVFDMAEKLIDYIKETKDEKKENDSEFTQSGSTTMSNGNQSIEQELESNTIEKFDSIDNMLNHTDMCTNELIKILDDSSYDLHPKSYKDFHEYVHNHSTRNTNNVNFDQIKRDSSAMLNTFNRYKQASIHKHTTNEKKGIIDQSKLYKYRVIENIFQTKHNNPKSQNHGVILFLDYSCSMRDKIKGVMLQILYLVEFCRRANVKFEVYAFSINRSNPSITFNRQLKYNEVTPDDSIEIINIFSSSMSKKDYDTNFNICMNIINGKTDPIYAGKTPIMSTILMMNKFLNLFKYNYGNIENITTVLLTDGGDNVGLNNLFHLQESYQNINLTFMKNDKFYTLKNISNLAKLKKEYYRFINDIHPNITFLSFFACEKNGTSRKEIEYFLYTMGLNSDKKEISNKFNKELRGGVFPYVYLLDIDFDHESKTRKSLLTEFKKSMHSKENQMSILKSVVRRIAEKI